MRRRDALELMDGQIPETENYAIENKIKEDETYAKIEGKGVSDSDRKSVV